jgi:hypothetical protein
MRFIDWTISKKGIYPLPMARIFAVSGHDFEDGLEGVGSL